MTAIPSVMVSGFVAILLANGCNSSEAAKVAQGAPGIGAEAAGERIVYVIDSEAGGVAGIAVGMTETELREAGWPYEARTEIQEGDEYKIYDIRLTADAWLECTLDLENILAGIESRSSEVRDKHGLGVGSTLGELKQAYPSGRMIKGIAEGRYASFVTDTRLIFRFDPNDLDDACFDHRQECAIDDSMAVQAIAIGRYAPK